MNARAHAIKFGWSRYEGAQCEHGHSGQRYTRNVKCVACAHENSLKLRAERTLRRQRRFMHLTRIRERTMQLRRISSRAKAAARRALLLSQRCACCTDDQIRHHYEIAALCGPFAHVDHVVPLALGGLHCAKNLQAITDEEHKEKTRRDMAAIVAARRSAGFGPLSVASSLWPRIH